MKRKIAAFAVASLVALSVQAQGPVENVQGTSVPAAKPSAAGGAKDFGTSIFYSAIDSFAVSPYSDGFSMGRSSITDGLQCLGGSTQSRAVGQVILPHGVDMDVLRVWGFDNGPENMQVTFQSSCLPDAAAALPTRTILASAASSGTPGEFSVSDNVLGNVNVDNESCTYQVIVRFGDTNVSCGVQLFFYKARIQWQRLIPPQPAVASFTDVPFGSQFYREVEALAATGITAGCTLTEFCPGNPVTRLQMAAFLARALGLAQTIVDPANP